MEALSDQEVQQAIEELKRSTAAIEKQTELLQIQQKAMSLLVKHEERVSQARSATNKSQAKKWELERQKIGKSVS